MVVTISNLLVQYQAIQLEKYSHLFKFKYFEKLLFYSLKKTFLSNDKNI